MNKIGYDHPHIVFYPDGTAQVVLQQPRDEAPGQMMDPNAAFALAVYEYALANHDAIKRWFCEQHPEATYKEGEAQTH